MFWNKKKTQLEMLIEKDGLDHAAKNLAGVINEKIPLINIARQFILEELDAARQGNSDAINFAIQSGIPSNEYEGAMKNSWEEVDGANGPQQLLHHILLSQLDHDRDLMLQMRFKVVEHIMKIWKLGKYNNEIEDPLDIFSFDNSDQVLSSPKGQSQFITLLDALKDIMKIQMWHVQKIDYGQKRHHGVLFAIVGQSYLKFNGPDVNIAREVEASECTLGIIENDLDVFPTVLLQQSFNFYQNEIEVKLELLDSRENGGYNAIAGLASMVCFTRDELLGSFAHLNPESEFEQLLDQYPLFESEVLYSNTFHDGPMDLANNLEDVMRDVMKIALRTIMNL